MNTGDTIIISLRFKRHPNPPAIRLKRLLKIALRYWSMECVDFRLIENQAVEPAKSPHHSNAEAREGVAPARNTLEKLP
jgi:hypothetical protein